MLVFERIMNANYIQPLVTYSLPPPKTLFSPKKTDKKQCEIPQLNVSSAMIGLIFQIEARSENALLSRFHRTLKISRWFKVIRSPPLLRASVF